MKTRDPIQQFLKEHKQVLAHVQALEQCVAEFRVKGYSRQRAARFARALDGVEQEVQIHNAIEEEALLKVLDQILPPHGPTFIMRQEHKGLRAVTRRLQDAFQALQRDWKNEQKLAKVRLTADLLIKLLREHIGKENDVLYPLARTFLTAQQMEQVAERLRRATLRPQWH